MTGKTRQIATLSLLTMAVGFAITLALSLLVWPGNGWLLALVAGFEAGLVGGMADWFAVTALFRHPLGLPIPHTAILPANRGRITQALVSMVENELLNKESILKKVQQMDAARLLLGALEKAVRTDAVKAMLVQGMRSIIKAMPEESVLSVLRDIINRYVLRADLGQLVKTLADEGLARHYDETALHFVLEKAEESLSGEKLRTELGKAAIRAALDMPLKGIMKATVPTVIGMMGEEKIGKLIQDFLLSAAKDMNHPANASRTAILESLRTAVGGLHENPSVLEKLEAYRKELLESAGMEEQLRSGLNGIRNELLRLIDSPDIMETQIVPFLEGILANTAADPETIGKLEDFLDAQLSQLIDGNHENIGRLVRENLEKFDTGTLIGMIESKVGNDLQWIRVNGAICGFAVGLLLYGVKMLTTLTIS